MDATVSGFSPIKRQIGRFGPKVVKTFSAPLNPDTEGSADTVPQIQGARCVLFCINSSQRLSTIFLGQRLA